MEMALLPQKRPVSNNNCKQLFIINELISIVFLRKRYREEGILGRDGRFPARSAFSFGVSLRGTPKKPKGFNFSSVSPEGDAEETQRE
jgi:hypothetical protein